MQSNYGKIISVKGYIAEVEFLSDPYPEINQLLILKDNTQSKMQVFKSASATSFYCIVLYGHEYLYRGAIIENTFKFLEVPVGEKLLGRIIDLFGNVFNELLGKASTN